MSIMHRRLVMDFTGRFLSHQLQTATRLKRPCDVFISYRTKDTQRTIPGLLYDYLHSHGLSPFLDNKTMKPGDKLMDKINKAIAECKVGVAVLSPRYCESYFCLHELALFMESNKKVIPIFCDIKPSQLRIGAMSEKACTPEEIERFRLALEEAKYTVGLTFNSSKGNLSDIVKRTSDIVIRTFTETANEDQAIQPSTNPNCSVVNNQLQASLQQLDRQPYIGHTDLYLINKVQAISQ